MQISADDGATSTNATSATSDTDFLRLQLDGVPYSTALLDEHGRIVAVNGHWRDFAQGNGGNSATANGAGLSYLDACSAADEPTAVSACAGIEDVLSGRKNDFELIYRCHSPTQMRWFRLVARRHDAPPYVGMVTIAHVDVTDFYVANAHSRIQASLARVISARLPLLEACRALALAVCHELDWDYAGIWTVDVPSWTLRCCDTWTRPEYKLAGFERASRAASLGPGNGLPGRAWTTAKVQWATDLDLDLRASDHARGLMKIMPPSAFHADFRTALAFPLKMGDDVLAVVDVFSRVQRRPDHALMELLESSGDQLALWELKERAEECARLAQSEADSARERLESVLDCAPAFVLVIDRDNAIQFINRTLPEIRKEDVIGRSWRNYVLPSHHPQVEAALTNVFRTGEPQSYEAVTTDENGSRRWFLNHMGPIRSGSHLTGAVVIAQDITEAKLAQEELHDAQRLAAVGTLAAGVAHEINTPVQFVSDSIHFLREAVNDMFVLVERLREVKQAVADGASAETLRAAVEAAEDAEEQTDLDYLRENVPKAFDRSSEGLGRVTTIVRSMKEFAHPAQKEMGPVDLNRAILATLTVARNEYRYVADLVTDFGELPPVICHVNDINQVVLNIVVNAAHAIEERVRGSEARGVITVRTRSKGTDVVISIEDTGGGIPESVRPRIFDPFFTTKEVGRGTGQGLAIARSTVREKHGGDLTFETQVGRGTTFFIRLPTRADAEQVAS